MDNRRENPNALQPAKSLGDTMEFNLLEAGWIPVLFTNGRFERIGIRRALTEAGAIRQIAASNPMDNVALLRFLLAVLMWCKPELSDDERASFATAKGVPEDWLNQKLGTAEQPNAVFDLLGSGNRFYQDASLKEKNRRPIADLLVEFPGANSVNHMRHIVHDDSYGFCPACCALGILRLSVWAPANGSYPASVNPGSAAYAITERRNLLLTLDVNLPNVASQPEQAPWLLSEPPDSPGPIVRLAWRPRKIWLHAADSGYCAYCGQFGTLLNSLCIEKGWPTPVTSGQQFGKAVLSEFQKRHSDYRAKSTTRRKLADKVVKIASVILKCRIQALLQADSNTAQAPTGESDAAKIARILDQLYTGGKLETIRELTKKPTKEEQPQLERDDTQVKKFWAEDPLLLKETEAIGLPDLNADVALHASKFWRDALRLRAEKAVAIGIVGDGQYIYHDTPAVTLPGAAALKLASLTKDCADSLGELKKEITPNPKRQHPEITAAIVLMTPETEARIRTTLAKRVPATHPNEYLREMYGPLVEHVASSTARGSPLRRREAMTRARSALESASNKTSQVYPASPGQEMSDTGPAETPKPKRPRKKKGGDT